MMPITAQVLRCQSNHCCFYWVISDNFAKNGNVVYHKKFYFIRDQTDDFELLKEIKRSKVSEKVQKNLLIFKRTVNTGV